MKTKKKTEKGARRLIRTASVAVAVLAAAIFGSGCSGNVRTDFSLDEFLRTAELVWEDDFDGTSLNPEKWNVEGEKGRLPRKGGYWTKDAVVVENGNLRIRTYRDVDGAYCSGGVHTKDRYAPRYGYFEARIRLPARYGVWGAFWMMPQNDDAFFSGNTDARTAGAEIDIMENPCFDKPRIQHAIHAGGYGPGKILLARPVHKCGNLGDIYGEFHTYGLYWDEDVYIFYVDRKPVWITDMRGNVSGIGEYLFLSVETGGKAKNGIPVPGLVWGNPAFHSPDCKKNDWSVPADMVVDRVRHYAAPGGGE